MDIKVIDFDFTCCYGNCGEAFTSMKHIKNEVRNSIDNQYLNDCLVCYIERDVFINVSNDVIIDRFQNMKTRRG
ncbi:hypothetical protein H5410_001198 [Solanum commersonii]|uniref:Uncharacterized protein n=1 Tax=Solanum commersonii TaxID=4109 RepID=A0A9J6AYJ8_SOLCO|nr:hypothetical protein H5410_001198 [Solanum commersonii]